jgi:hypothetical protein
VAFNSTHSSKTISRLYKGLNQLQCSILTQLHVGHIRLNTFLHRFKLTPSPMCSHCAIPESVPHFLLTCPKYRAQRLTFIMCIGTAHLSLHHLISTKHDAALILVFVCDTGHFPRYAL